MAAQVHRNKRAMQATAKLLHALCHTSSYQLYKGSNIAHDQVLPPCLPMVTLLSVGSRFVFMKAIHPQSFLCWSEDEAIC